MSQGRDSVLVAQAEAAVFAVMRPILKGKGLASFHGSNESLEMTAAWHYSHCDYSILLDVLFH
jgi:hypothetical protein